MTANLMCSGARTWQCWNSIGFSGALAAKRAVEAITNRLFQLDGFDAQFSEIVEAAGKDISGSLSERWAKLRRAEEQFNKERENLKATLKAFQRRFHPETLNGKADETTMARLRALKCVTPPWE